MCLAVQLNTAETTNGLKFSRIKHCADADYLARYKKRAPILGQLFPYGTVYLMNRCLYHRCVNISLILFG